jgi:nitroreductase
MMQAPSPWWCCPPWAFILVTDRAQLRELASVFRGAGHVAESAATIAVIGPAQDNEFHPAQLDLGQATMTMLLAAADLGIGSSHAGVADTGLARELLGFPENRDWVLLISLGYPAGRPLAPVKNPRRRPFAEVVHYGRWQPPGQRPAPRRRQPAELRWRTSSSTACGRVVSKSSSRAQSGVTAMATICSYRSRT